MMKMKSVQYLFCSIILVACGSKNTPIAPLPEPEPEEKIIDWNSFADDFQSSLVSIYSGSRGTYITNPNQPGFNYWFNAHVLDVLVDGYTRTEDPAYLDKMKQLVQGIKSVNTGYWQVYVDDMAWLGISSMNAWAATKDDDYKNVAKYILGEIKKAHTPVLGGGLQWRFDQPNGKNACSTAPGAILALRLYYADKNEDNLAFSKQLFGWLTTTLLNSSNNLIWDNIHLDDQGNPEIQTWMFTYNVGTYIGTARDLFLNTGDDAYLQAAARSAIASISSSDMVANGMFKETGDHDGGLFKGILIRYLTELVFTDDIPIDVRDQIINFISYNATILYEKGSSPSPRVFASSDWSVRPERPNDISTQLSAMMLVEAMTKFKKADLLTSE